MRYYQCQVHGISAKRENTSVYKYGGDSKWGMGCTGLLKFPVGKCIEYETDDKQEQTYTLYHTILQIEAQMPGLYPGKKKTCAEGTQKQYRRAELRIFHGIPS